jgi:hypothetical protein
MNISQHLKTQMFVDRTLPHLKLICVRSPITQEKTYCILKHNSASFKFIYIEVIFSSAVMKPTYFGMATLVGAVNSVPDCTLVKITPLSW